MPTPEEMARLEEFLKPTRIVVVVTLDGSGMPQVTPNWYTFSDGQIHISTTKDRAKHINLARDNRLALCIYSGTEAPEYVSLYGHAEISDDDSIWPITHEIVKRHVPADGVENRMAQLRTQDRVILSLAPERVVFRAPFSGQRN